MQTGAIKVTKVERSRISSVDFTQLPFGKHFTDHMLVAHYREGQWLAPEIVPYGPISFDPSMATLHYGQSIFEGIKAYRLEDGAAAIFRPDANLKRFNHSARRMEMPDVPSSIFLDGMMQLVQLDIDWIPQSNDNSLYIRPFMFGTDAMIGVHPSSSYTFMIILSPVGPYYAAPMRICVEETFVRAVPGGVGFAKTSGNYAAALHPTEIAHQRGYDQVLWTDAFEHKYVQECGTMNVFFVLDGKLVTPGLTSGTILHGITRDSVIQLARDHAMPIEEREISVDELVEGYHKGTLTEVFGAGTAATVAKIVELTYKNLVMKFDANAMPVAIKLKALLTGIRDGAVADTHGWMIRTQG